MRPIDMVKFQREEPPPPLWEELFGPYPWFVAPFIGDLVSATGQRSTDVWSSYRRDAFDAIPGNWKHSSPWGQWEQLSQVQFKACLAHNLVRLDKAALSIALVAIAYRHELHGINSSSVFADEDIWPYQMILPSCFIIDWPSRALLREGAFIDQIAARVSQTRLVVFEALRGYAVIESIAHAIVDALKEHSDAFAEVRLLRTRRDYGASSMSRPVVGQRINASAVQKFYDVELWKM